MKRQSVLIFGTIVLGSVTLWTAHGQSKNDTANYRRWTQVNPKPLKMSSWVSAMCADSPKFRMLQANDPHAGKFFIVYVNALGKNTMLTQAAPKFPVGTVIVKEKVPTAPGISPEIAEWKGKAPYPEPELLTIMRKREKGYFPAGGDWEYGVMDGTGQKTLKQGKLKVCASCHAPYRTTDFVTRNYMPGKVVRTLHPKTMPKPH